jgi:hypothetical protein
MMLFFRVRLGLRKKLKVCTRTSFIVYSNTIDNTTVNCIKKGNTLNVRKAIIPVLGTRSGKK